MKTIHIKVFAVLALMLALSSCNIYRPYKTPEMNTDDLYRTDVPADSANMALRPWQELFTDQNLRNLIDSALVNNFDYQTAMYMVEEANAAFAQGKAAFFPTLNISADGTLSKVEDVPHGEYYNIAAAASWELDIFGRLRSAKRAAKAALLQSIAYKRAVETQVIASVANGYYTLLSLDKQLRVYDETILLWSETVRTMEDMMEAGSTNLAAVTQSRANLYSAQAAREDILYNIRVTENSLRLLIGQPAGEIVRGTFEDQQLTTDLQVGLPSQLLANRPDVQQAEAGVRAAFAKTNVARAAFYPRFTITANGGYANDGTVSFAPGAFFANLVGGLVQPLFNAGTNRANLRIAKAHQEEALLAFEKSLINAGIEVSNLLYNYNTTAQKLDARAQQVEQLQIAVDATNELFKLSSTTYLEVLTAQQSLLSARISQIGDQLTQMENVVNLYQALGGGWERPVEEEK